MIQFVKQLDLAYKLREKDLAMRLGRRRVFLAYQLFVDLGVAKKYGPTATASPEFLYENVVAPAKEFNDGIMRNSGVSHIPLV